MKIRLSIVLLEGSRMLSEATTVLSGRDVYVHGSGRVKCVPRFDDGACAFHGRGAPGPAHSRVPPHIGNRPRW